MNVQDAVDKINSVIEEPFDYYPVGEYSRLNQWLIPENGELDLKDKSTFTVGQLIESPTEDAVIELMNMKEAAFDRVCSIDQFLAYIDVYKIWDAGNHSEPAPHINDYSTQLSIN